MDTASKNRVRLWLRAERAFGLSQATAPRVALSPGHSNEIGAVRAFIAPPEDHPVLAPTLAPRAPREKEPAPAEPALIPLPVDAPLAAPEFPRARKVQLLAELDANEVTGCTRCTLCRTRDKTVFGEGDPDARVMFVGEGPGANEDASGRPFVGRAGQLLDKMIAGMGMRREQVYIANIVKCRAFLPGPPPKDRPPTPQEVATCTPYLERQLEIIRPKVIVTLGLPAAKYMLNVNATMSKLRGTWQSWRGIKLMPTFHPSYVLRSYTREVREAVWADLKNVLKELGLPVPARGAVGDEAGS